MYFSDFSDQARIWIYQSDQPISDSIRNEMKSKLKDFVNEWSAHGTKLKAIGELVDDYRIILCTDGNVEASGCSIDASVRFIKELGKTFHLNFFNRLQILVEKNGQKELMHFSQLNGNKEVLVYQPAPKNLGDFRNKEKISTESFLAN